MNLVVSWIRLAVFNGINTEHAGWVESLGRDTNSAFSGGKALLAARDLTFSTVSAFREEAFNAFLANELISIVSVKVV